jgi:Flp pilus assembly protein CpaB
LSYRLFASHHEEPAPAPGRLTALIARKNVDKGTFMQDPQKWFDSKQVAPGEVPENAIAISEALKGKYLNRSLRKCDYVTPDDLCDSADAICQWQLPEGYRAVVLRISDDDVPGVLRLVNPWTSITGDIVDILVAANHGSKHCRPCQARFEHVLVLDAKQGNETRQGTPGAPFVLLTVALSEEDAGYFEQESKAMRIEIRRSTYIRPSSLIDSEP